MKNSTLITRMKRILTDKLKLNEGICENLSNQCHPCLRTEVLWHTGVCHLSSTKYRGLKL